MLRRNYWKVSLLFFPLCTGASVNFTVCLASVVNCASGGPNCPQNLTNSIALSIFRTSGGESITTADQATAISYHGCVNYCGADQEPFNWSVFSQEYSAWLLPYLALLSQLPFGARRRTENLMSAVLTLGSPTLAGYSLYMTLLNARWLNDSLFAGIDYPSRAVRQSVVQALSSLQHVPLRVHPMQSGRFESLVVHPANDQWWDTFAKELDYSHTWSIASATSIMWVVIAYLLTVADSLSNVSDNIDSTGQGTGSIWLWLLPIVIGWLILSPKCDYDRVHEAYEKANRQVFEAHGTDATADPIHVTNDFGLTINPSPDWALFGKHTSSPDELLVPPVFNYARTLSWCSSVYMIALYYRAAWRKSNDRQGVNGEHIPGNVRSNVPPESRLGSREEIIRYCSPDGDESSGARVLWPQGMLKNMVLASLMSLTLQWGTTIAAFLAVLYTPTIGLGCRSLAYLLYGVFSTTVWLLLVLSNLLGYYAHHLLNDPQNLDLESRRPPIPSTSSRPQRSVYVPVAAQEGTESSRGITSIPLRDMRSSVIEVGVSELDNANIEPNADESDGPNGSFIAAKTFHDISGRKHVETILRVADWLRWIGKLLAVINAIGIIANSVFQYAGVYDTCYCNSSVFGWREHAFNVISPSQNDIDKTRSFWIGAFFLSLISSVFFVGSIYLVGDSLPPTGA